MSGRGGGRGGRGGAGGRGGGRGGFSGSDRPRGGPEGIAVGTLSQADLEKVQKNIGTDLYPPDYQPKTMDNPNTSESRISVFTRELAKTLRYSPYRLTDEVGKDDMASYTDKYKQKRSLNALNLDHEALGMSKEFFPKGVWEMYFEGKDPEGAKRQKKERKKKNLDDLDEGGDSEEEYSDEDVMLEDQLSEEEDYGEDDYGNNYFDAGEEDGGDEDGGGGGDEF